MSVQALAADYLISSANKCVEGVPGFGFVIARRADLEKTAGYARSLSLDLFDQWREMETKGGKWRYTSPTHVLLALDQALKELTAEGGIAARNKRYSENHRILVAGLVAQEFEPLLPAALRSPIITSFLYPSDNSFTFAALYEGLKRRGFVIYPGKVSHARHVPRGHDRAGLSHRFRTAGRLLWRGRARTRLENLRRLSAGIRPTYAPRVQVSATWMYADDKSR